jgi:formamidopyrimidine-DNA glycosylase
MPELPEVETVKRVLEPQLKGRRIVSVKLNKPEIIAHPSAEKFSRRVKNAVVLGMGRRGKFLSIELDNGRTIRLHLRMTGQLLVTPHAYPQEKHTHIVFRLDNGEELRFIDTRRFGRFWLLENGEDDTYSGADKLGLEPFDRSFSAEYLRGKVGTSKRAIKTCLLDQSAVAGIGNIYSDEILFAARIDPARPADSLSALEWKRLAKIIPERLGYFIEKNRISPEDYLAGKGEDYRNTQFLQVYGHAGEPCPKCGVALMRVVIGGRSSTYCAKCQR